MMRRYNELEEIGRIKHGEIAPPGPPIPGVVLEVSGVGPLQIKWPILDARLVLRVRSELPGNSLALMAYSVIGEQKNNLELIFRYADGVISDRQMGEIAKTVRYALMKISLDRTMQSAFEELRQFYVENRSPRAIINGSAKTGSL
jgi:hypothetical protein